MNSPFPFRQRRDDARQRLLRNALKRKLLGEPGEANEGLSEPATIEDLMWNQAPKHEVDEDDITKKMVGANTPWPVILQHSQRAVSPVSISETELSTPDSPFGSHLLEVALQKCVERLAIETSESPQTLRRRVLARLKENRVSRKTVTSAVRFLRDAHGDRWLEMLEEDA